jgi:thymidine phosphorylase
LIHFYKRKYIKKMNGHPALTVQEIIEKKRDGEALSKDEIDTWVEKVVTREVAHVQLGAWLMAVYLKGLSSEETSYLTRAMVEHGETLTWPEHWPQNLIVDKHSTGGVGDKVSLPLAPALAACGLKVPMISGRGLGMTGGTLDKLESIPGFTVQMSKSEITEILDKVGCCIVGQTAKICPADKTMYQARDVTGTVGCQGLITSSIISKKVAEGISCLVLDVKWGLGSYNGNLEDAETLAKSLSEVANSLGVKTKAVLSHMNHPLGLAVGNSLEVIESIQCLQGSGPADLRELVCLEGGILLQEAGLVNTREEGEEMLGAALDNGTALHKFAEMLKFQGVNKDTVEKLMKLDCNNNTSVLPSAKHVTNLVCEQSGFVEYIDARVVARLAVNLGAGRSNPEDKLDHSVGVLLRKSPGDSVEVGEVWAQVHHNTPYTPTQQIMKALSVVQSRDLVGPRISKIVE